MPNKFQTSFALMAVAAGVLGLGVSVARAQEKPVAAAPLDATPTTRLADEVRCHLGVYALPANRFMTVTGAGGHLRNLQYTLSSGPFGTLHAQRDGAYTSGTLAVTFAPCAAGALTLMLDSKAEQGRRLRLSEQVTQFQSEGVTLHGKLVSPAGNRARTLAVWIEGSNNNPSTDDAVWAYELARRGVAVFVYDKRGTGLSSGAQSSDFHVRARDTVAAIEEAKRLAPQIRRVGVIGGSQGGWVAPLVATLTSLDFVIPAFALADGPIAQDKALVELQLRQAGFDDQALAQARELTAITERIVRSNMEDGFEELDALKSRNGEAAWIQAIQPRSYTGLFVRFSTPEIKAIGPAAAQGLSFTYDPRPTIETIKPRQLWLLGGADQQAPNAATQRILREIQQTRTDLAVVVFPKADHGLIEPIVTDNGVGSAFVPGLFDITAAWIKTGRLPAKGMFVTMPISK